MKIAYYFLTPPPSRPEIDGAVQEALLLQRTHGGSIHHLYPFRRYHRFVPPSVAALGARRALERLARLPEEAFNDPQALLDRAAWEHWLKSRPVGLTQGSGPQPPG